MGDRKTAAPSQWMVQTKRADFSGIAQKYGISPSNFRDAPEKLIQYENKSEYMRSLSI